MRFAIRIVIGAVLGLVAFATLWLLDVRAWVVALASGLLGPIGFLGSFFIWSADRPEIGYEQVLFDKPNSIISAVMILALAGGAFGVAHLGAGSASPPPDPNAAAMESQHQTLVHLYNLLIQGKLASEQAPDAKTNLSTAQEAIAKLPAGPKATALATAAATLSHALDAYAGCSYKACQTANLALFDAKDALKRFDDAG